MYKLIRAERLSLRRYEIGIFIQHFDLPHLDHCTIYLTIIPRTRAGYELLDSGRGAEHQVGYHKLISDKREWNNCFIKYQALDKNILNYIFYWLEFSVIWGKFFRYKIVRFPYLDKLKYIRFIPWVQNQSDYWKFNIQCLVFNKSLLGLSSHRSESIRWDIYTALQLTTFKPLYMFE